MKCLHPALENRRAWPGESFDIAECVECHSTVSIAVEEAKVSVNLPEIKLSDFSALDSLLRHQIQASQSQRHATRNQLKVAALFPPASVLRATLSQKESL